MPKSTPTIPSMSTREFTWGIRYLLFQLLFLPGLLGALLHTLWPDFPSLGINFIYYLINFLTIVCILHNYLEKDGAFAIKHWRQLLLTVGIGFAVYWVSNVAVGAMIGYLQPNFFNINDATISAMGRNNLLLMAVGTVVFVPTAEELLYRGLVFGGLRRRSRLLAYALSVAVFCAIHVMGYWGRYEPLHLLLCFVQYIPAGLVLAAAYAFSGSVFAPILIHTAVNLIGFLSMR